MLQLAHPSYFITRTSVLAYISVHDKVRYNTLVKKIGLGISAHNSNFNVHYIHFLLFSNQLFYLLEIVALPKDIFVLVFIIKFNNSIYNWFIVIFYRHG